MNKILIVLLVAAALCLPWRAPALAGAFYDDLTPAKEPKPSDAPKAPTPSANAEVKTPSLSGTVTRVTSTATFELQPEGKPRAKPWKIELADLEKAWGAQIMGDMTILIGSRARYLTCTQAGQATWRCVDKEGKDIAEQALRQGIVRALPSAPEAYKQAESEARKAKAGIWR